MNKKLIFVGSIMLIAEFAYAQDNPILVPFADQASSVTSALSCAAPKITPRDSYYGALYGCIMGEAQTVKFFINESHEKPGNVRSIKLIWNDWTKDIGYGVHADQQEAKNMIKAFALLYAPEKLSQIQDAFFSNQNVSINTDGLSVEYSYSIGPSIDERMLIIRPSA